MARSVDLFHTLLIVAFIAPLPVAAQVIVDNDDGAPNYVEVGAWITSGATGYNGGNYRFAVPGGTKTATWTGNLAAADQYEVFVWYVPGGNRTTSTRYDIHAADQTYTVFLDQTAGGFAWESLGTYAFAAGPATITLDAGASTGGTAVIADAVRFGGGGGGVCTLDLTEEIADGVHHAVYTCPAPQVLHVVEFDLADARHTVEMGFAQGKRNYTAKQRTSQIAGHYNAPDHEVIAAINASHFDAGLYIHGMLGTGSNVVGFPTVSWPAEAYVLQESAHAFVTTATPNADAAVRFADGAERRIDVFDYTCTTNTLAVYTPDWGASTASTAAGVEVIVDDVSYPWRLNKWVSGVVTAVQTGAASIDNPIPSGGFVLSACPGAEADLLAHVTVGDRIDARVSLQPSALNNARVICGGASGWLVKDGAPFPENWTYSHAPVRHPRTVLAWHGTRHWFVTCDGRQAGYSAGMTYTEMADFLVNTLAVDQAVNLDGGGSTTMLINGAVANCPSDGAATPCTGTERAVPNALLLVKRDATTAFPLHDDFTAVGRALPWDDKFSFNHVTPFTPAAPGGDGHVLQVISADGAYESIALGASGDTNYTVDAWIYCEYRPNIADDGFERVGLFARDDGNANFEGTSLGGGNCYALTFDTDSGRIQAGVVVDGVLNDFLDSTPIFETDSGWYRFRIACYGSTVRFQVDDDTVALVSDSAHTHGRFGIGYHSFFDTATNMRGTRAEHFAAYAANGDFDGDGDFDLDDYVVLTACMHGPDQDPSPPPPLTADDCFDVFDTDADLDVDLQDFAVVERALAAPPPGSTPTVLSGFEGYANGAEVIFREPRYSGSTASHLAASPNVNEVTDEVAAFAGSKCYKLAWQFVDSSTQRWLRATSSNAANIPNPTIEFDKPVRVRLRLDSGSLRVTLGVRETGTSAAVGQNGGTSGTIEWVGAGSQVGSAPQGKLVSAAPGVWQTVEFDPVLDPILGFTGNGVLSSATNRGTFEHLAFSRTGAAGPFTVYIDGVEQLCEPSGE